MAIQSRWSSVHSSWFASEQAEASARSGLAKYRSHKGVDDPIRGDEDRAALGRNIRQIVRDVLGVPLSQQDVKIKYPLPSKEQARKSRKLLLQYHQGDQQGFDFEQPTTPKRKRDGTARVSARPTSTGKRKSTKTKRQRTRAPPPAAEQGQGQSRGQGRGQSQSDGEEHSNADTS